MSIFCTKINPQYIERVRLFMQGETPDTIENKHHFNTTICQNYRVFLELQKSGRAPTLKEIKEISDLCKVPSNMVLKMERAMKQVKQESRAQIIQ